MLPALVQNCELACSGVEWPKTALCLPQTAYCRAWWQGARTHCRFDTVVPDV